MSRQLRTARGVFGAFIATTLAAASHALAGGTIAPASVFATAVLSLPLCVLLAGRVGSLWRLALGVGASQFVYHWLFAGFGAASSQGSALTGDGLAVSPHAAHLAALSLPAAMLETGGGSAVSSTWMWVAHALAATLTTALMYRGERAALRIMQVLREAVTVQAPEPVRVPERPVTFATHANDTSRAQQIFLTAISHRGPPSLSLI